MKMTPELKRVQEKMAPGIITSQGFLGDDRRPLVDIIQADENAAAAIGLDWNTVSEKLMLFYKEGQAGLGNTVIFDNKWEITVTEARGFLPCPFGDGLYRKHTIEITHIATGIQLDFSELSHHLLHVHHFLQGKNSPFRIEPKVLKKILEI